MRLAPGQPAPRQPAPAVVPPSSHPPLARSRGATGRLVRFAALAATLVATTAPGAACAQATRVRKDAGAAQATEASGRWTVARARAWQDSVGWQVGANFVPSSAGNQLEMWQAATWDPTTIDRELGWARSLGMNTMRVFLHDLAWAQDSTGFLGRMDEFLRIAERHRIRPMFVVWDAVWDPNARPGPQRAPRPHLHNSIWVQSPSGDVLRDSLAIEQRLGPYVRSVFARFARDGRILAWDLYNEPDNINRPAYVAYEPVNKGDLALRLLRRTWDWARAAQPIHPLTVGPWYGDFADTTRMHPVFRYALANSDVVTFHTYDVLDEVRTKVANLERLGGGRPVLCTEYMARPRGSTFQAILPFFKERRVGAYNWGFVNGRSPTSYPWDSWTQEYTAEPTEWFHDIFQTDGRPYREAEVSLIRSLTGAAATTGTR